MSHRLPAGRPRRRRTVEAALITAATLLFVPANTMAQEGVGAGQGHVHGERDAGSVHGRVTSSEDGAPIEGVRVWVVGTARGALTDAAGGYRIARVPAGPAVVVFEHLGRRTERRAVTVPVGGDAALDVALAVEALAMPDVVVSTTREARAISRTPATVGVVTGESIRRERPTHPSEVLGEVPGVWVNTTSGEGHMTAIRQPLTTDAVYLYLEDGVPTRSTGFFNHNALYEVNVPQAERIEVVKGPVTALYGSDAIGGVINVETRPAVASPGLHATLEGGADGYARALGSYAFVTGGAGVRADLNLTRSDGWRDGTAYDRQSGTVRWDQVLGDGATLKTIAAFSRVSQQTAGSSRLPEAAYLASPERNLTPVSFRDVVAARLSAAYERRGDGTLLSLTPFARYNAMDMLPNWSLTYDPAVARTSNRSLGVLARARWALEPWDARLIAGLDVDWSPGEHRETAIDPLREHGVFTGYAERARIYDYDVAFLGISPYLHAEASPLPRLRVTAGLRLDRLAYHYENRLGALQTGAHRRPASTTVRYTELSPKLGATFEPGGGASIYASYGQGFRAPSEAQLFRQGTAENTAGLEPVEAESWEAGVRGTAAGKVSYSLAAYRMTKSNDILDFQRADDVRETRNAGRTLHRGVELGLGLDLPGGFVVRTALSYARHTYERWRPEPGIDYGGHEMESAPRTLGTTEVRWTPERGRGGVALEWVHLGAYWMDAANTQRYAGHDLLNLHASWAVTPEFTLFGKLKNVTDERYAESAGWSAFRGRELAPGRPRTLFAGVTVHWRRP